MKTTNIKYKALLLMVLGLALIGVNCKDDSEGWADERYLTDFNYFLNADNPLTGEPYTEEEIAELTFDPKVKGEYAEGQNVVIALVSQKMPGSVKILSGVDFSEIGSLTSFTAVDGGYKSEEFTATLEELGLNEIGDKGTLKFDIVFEDESVGAVNFEVKRVKFFDPNAVIDTFVYLVKQTGETVPLAIDENVTSRVASAPYGNIVELNGADNKVEVLGTETAFRETDDFSVGFWVNTNSTNSDPSMVGDKDWGSGGNPGFVFAFTGDSWKLNAGDGANRIDIDGTAINDGEWHYLMATFDKDGSAVLYQDGAAVGSADISAFGSMKSNLPIFVGQDGTGNYGDYFEGKIGNVTVFDYALSGTQVEGISTPYTGVKLRKSDGLIKHLPVAVSGAPNQTYENDRFVFEFNGADQYATIDNGDLGFRHESDYSISFWVNTTSGDSDPIMIGDQNWDSSSNLGLSVAFRGSNWRVATSDGDTKADTDHNSGFNDGAWHFLTITFDRDGNMTLYADGLEVSSTDMSALGSTDSGNPLRLAQDGPATYGQFFQGKIADAVIYDYVLSPETIKVLSGN